MQIPCTSNTNRDHSWQKYNRKSLVYAKKHWDMTWHAATHRGDFSYENRNRNLAHLEKCWESLIVQVWEANIVLYNIVLISIRIDVLYMYVYICIYVIWSIDIQTHLMDPSICWQCGVLPSLRIIYLHKYMIILSYITYLHDVYSRTYVPQHEFEDVLLFSPLNMTFHCWKHGFLYDMACPSHWLRLGWLGANQMIFPFVYINIWGCYNIYIYIHTLIIIDIHIQSYTHK